MRDPNFPDNLAIVASTRRNVKLAPVTGDQGQGRSDDAVDDDEVDDAAQDIEQFGIAGRTWEAAYLMRAYLTPPQPSSSTHNYDPACPLFLHAASPSSASRERRQRRIVEVGSGTGFLSLHLAPHLTSNDRLVMTDLEEVCRLLETNLSTARQRWTSRQPPTSTHADVIVRPLPWGSEDHLRLLLSNDLGHERPDIILASDLVYFPFLYPGLLRTLIGLTEDSSCATDRERKPPTQVLFSYKIRSLVREQPFWSAFGRWFRFEPVFVVTRPVTTCDSPSPNEGQPLAAPTYTRFGAATPSLSTSASGRDETDELFMLVCTRRAESMGWTVSADDDELMNGQGQDPDGQFEMMMLGCVDWE